MMGRAWIVPKEAKFLQGTYVTFIGVPGVSPKPLVGMQ